MECLLLCAPPSPRSVLTPPAATARSCGALSLAATRHISHNDGRGRTTSRGAPRQPAERRDRLINRITVSGAIRAAAGVAAAVLVCCAVSLSLRGQTLGPESNQSMIRAEFVKRG